jgi:ABC-type nickel/cobalt efflux system permease component RcnA
MISLVSIIALGFFLGMRHATDPDHVIAVTTILSRERRIGKSAWIGISWGIGHTITILAVGTAIILFGLVIPPRLGLGMELAVALMLVVLGAMNLWSFSRDISGNTAGASQSVHSHAHAHGDYIHTHPHGHRPEKHSHSADKTPVSSLDRLLYRFKAYRLLRPLIIGVVHGLAGSAAVALLVVPAIRDVRWAVAYLLVFGLGTVAGMMLITVSIASSFHLVNGGSTFFRRLALASGLLSLGFGFVVAYQILVIHGLMSANPHWTPR